MDSLLRNLTSWLDLLLEANCPLCHRSTNQELCSDCQRQVQRCQLANQTEGWQASLPVFAWGTYGGALKRSIAALKYNNQPQLARLLGQWSAQAWLSASISQTKALVVVPIPMHPTKQRERGFNQAELIARSFCQRTGLPMQSQGLLRTRATEAQFSLSATARAQNLSGAFQVSKDLTRQSTSRAILLIDDIYTTGATAQAAVQALKQHQIPVYGLVAVAKSSGRQA